MKKILIVLCLMALTLALSGCEDKSETKQDSGNVVSDQSAGVLSQDSKNKNDASMESSEEMKTEEGSGNIDLSEETMMSKSTETPDIEETGESLSEAVEATTEQTQTPSTEQTPSQETTTSTETEQQHTHTWVTETRYRTVHHDAVYENKTIIDQAAWDEKVVDQAAWDETVTAYTIETQYIEMCHCNHCGYCGTFDQIQAHMNSDINCAFAGFDTYYDTVTEQVPHTETVHHDAVTHIVHHDAVTHVEKVLVKDAYDEQVPYTVTVCSECGKEQ